MLADLLYILLLGATNASNISDTIPVVKSDTLREVVITADKVRHDAEGYRLNVSSFPQLQTMDMAQMLHFLPGMVVDRNTMTVFGNRVGRLYVNGKQIHLSGEDLHNYLASIDGSNVRSIKVVESAGAEVNAQTAGMAIIKITTKRTDDGGLATISVDGDESFDGRSATPRFRIEHRSGPWSLYSNGSYMKSHREMDSRTVNSYEDTQGTVHNDANSTNNNRYYSIVIGSAYGFSSTDYLAFDAIVSNQRFRNKGLNSVVKQSQKLPEEQYQIDSYGRSDDSSHSLSSQYVHQWASGNLSLSVFAQWDCKKQQQDQHRSDATTYLNHTQTDAHHRLLTADANISHRLTGSWGKIDTGGSCSFWRNSDDTETYRFRYTEQTVAAYLSWDWEKGAFNSSLGLRYEHKEVNAAIVDSGDNRNTYDNLFPSLRLNYELNRSHGHSLRFNAQRYYRLPDMMMMNPFVQWEGDYSYSTGNPNLLPAFGKTLSAHLTLWRNYSVKATYSNSEDFIRVHEREKYSNVLCSTYANGVHQRGWQIEASAMFVIGKSGVLNLNGQRRLYTLTYGQQHVHSYLWMSSAALSYRLPYGFNLRVSGSYYSPFRSIQTKEVSRLSGSTGVSHSFLHNALDVSVNYSIRKQSTINTATSGIMSCRKTNSSIHKLNLSVRYRLQWGNRNAKVKTNTANGIERLRM